MTTQYEENPDTGYFNTWSGRHPHTAVRSLDLYLAWRDGAPLPPLASFPALTHVSVPLQICDEALLDHLAALPHVRSLRVYHGPGDPIPAKIFSLVQLTALYLDSNEVSVMPDLFDRLPDLTVLGLGANELSEIPPSVLRLPALRRLDVSSNQIAQLPTFAVPLASLDVSWNPLADLGDLPLTLQELGAACESVVTHRALPLLRGLRELTLRVGADSSLPDLSALHQLARFDVSGPALDESLFDRLPRGLEALHCVSPRLARVPSSIQRCVRLHALTVSSCGVTELAPELAGVPLATFGAALTQLADTPTYRFLPLTLRVLHLANCGMTRVPERIRELVHLDELGLELNKLVDLPAWLSRIPTVRYR